MLLRCCNILYCFNSSVVSLGEILCLVTVRERAYTYTYSYKAHVKKRVSSDYKKMIFL